MSTKKITALTELSAAPAATDVVPIVDVSDTTDASSGTTKKITPANIHKAAGIGAGNTTAEPVKIDTSNGRLGVGTNAPGALLEVAGATVPAEINSTNSNGNKLAWSDNGTVRGYVGATSAYSFTAANSAGTVNFHLDANGYINLIGSATYDDDDAHNIGSIAHKFAVLTLKETAAGDMQIPFFAAGGLGVDFEWCGLDVDTGTWSMFGDTTISVQNPGTSGNTYNVTTNNGTGQLSVERTAGSSSYFAALSRYTP